MVQGRAETDEQKEAIVRRILDVWMQFPELRLGQLLVNGLTTTGTFQRSLFYLEDEKLVALLERFEAR
jgi:hypothetical protein